MVKLIKNTLKSKNFPFFSICSKIKVFELTDDCLILYFSVVFPVKNILRIF